MMIDDKNSAGSGSYVLNAMDETERTEFETQLAESEELRSEVTELTDTAVLLGLAAVPISPSAELKQSIMSRLSQTPQLDRDDDVPRPALPTGSLRETHPKARARWFSGPVAGLVAAAAAVVLIVGGVVGSGLAIQGARSSQQANALAAISASSDVRRAEATVATGGSVTLVWSLDLKKSALIGKGLKVLPNGKTYELWYISASGTPTPAGLFESNGVNTLQVLTGHMTKGDTVGVTIEPSGGSKAPTTKPVVAIASA